MDKADNEKQNWKYEEIFFSDSLKAQAFDEIAKRFYKGNFGTMQKSDFEILLFSLYIERILETSEDDMNSYSDYTLAKQLGITQSKVSNLKVKKQLQYPYEKFDWKKSFERSCKNARYENGKIKINLRDKNLFYELKNQIDENGGFVEVSLTPSLFVVSISDFYNLIESTMNESETQEFKNAIRDKFKNNQKLCGELEKKSVGEVLKSQGVPMMVDFGIELAKDFLPVPISIPFSILGAAMSAIKPMIGEN